MIYSLTFTDLSGRQHSLYADDRLTAQVTAAQLSIQFKECTLYSGSERWLYRHGENTSERDATTEEINEAVDSYKVVMLIRHDHHNEPCYRPFDCVRDVHAVQAALASQSLRARSTSIIEAALKKGLC